MESFKLAFDVVAPLVVYMAVGALAKKLHILSERTLLEMNTFIFKVMISLSLFFDIYSADLSLASDPWLFILTGLLITACFGVSLLIAKMTIKEGPDVPTAAQGAARSNYVLFGTVISASIAGDAGVAVTAALCILVVPLLNILSVVLFETQRGGKVDVRRVLLQIAKNPLVIFSLLGAAANLMHVPLPDIIYTPLNTLGDLASPLALVVLGGMLSFKSMVSHRGRLLAAVAGKLVIVPVVCLGIMIALGYRGPALVSLMAAFASPTAVASSPMAQSMGGNGRLAGEIVAVSTAGSILTVFLFTAALSALGLF